MSGPEWDRVRRRLVRGASADSRLRERSRGVNGLALAPAEAYRSRMTRIHLHAPTFSRDIEIDAVDDLIEAEGLTWAREGDVDGVPRYVPAAAG